MTLGKGNLKQGAHSRKTRSRIFKILLIQAVICLMFSAGLMLVDLETAYSALLGGAIYLLPTLYFADRALRFSAGQSAKHALAEMYMSQIWKMALMTVGFAAVFITIQPLNPFSLFGTFILMQILNWVAQIGLNTRFLKL